METNNKNNEIDTKEGIVVIGVNKSFGKEKVLRDVKLIIPSGKIYGVVGNNGSGKTVLMKCICGFMLPDSGKIYVGGQQVGRDCDFPDSLGIIIETPGFLPYLTGYQNLKILASLKAKIGKKEIIDALEKVGLKPTLRKPVSKYSLGMRQRLGIAQVLMEDPDFILLDEPMNGLDNEGVVQMRELFIKLKQQGKTFLVVSHNRDDIEALCDEVYEMDAGMLKKLKK